MIKGVNKKVVEINNPRSIYFERAVFYLKPNMSLMPEKLIKREAEELVRELVPKGRKKAVLWKIIAGIALGAAVISTAALVIAALM